MRRFSDTTAPTKEGTTKEGLFGDTKIVSNLYEESQRQDYRKIAENVKPAALMLQLMEPI